jgi:hypothetical protein
VAAAVEATVAAQLIPDATAATAAASISSVAATAAAATVEAPQLSSVVLHVPRQW